MIEQEEQEIEEAWSEYNEIRDEGETAKETFGNGIRKGIQLGILWERNRANRRTGGVANNDSASVSQSVTECEVSPSGEGASGEEVSDGLRDSHAGRDEPEPDQLVPVDHSEGTGIRTTRRPA